MKKVISIFLCAAVLFAFTSCKKDSANGIITDSGGVSQQSESGEASAVSSADESGKADNKKESTTKESTTTPMPETSEKDSIPISSDEAFKRLCEFYGNAYTVEQKELKGDIQHYEVRDSKGNIYSEIEVNLKNSDAKETIVHSKEVNKFNLLV
ncbi:MAG: hypothetical protein IKR97_00850 [Eubacterium sp.]|nr:hypothetical protein [Eubacterium sp.]